MKRAAPWENVEELSSDSDSDKNDCSMVGSSRKGNNVARSKDVSSENGAGVLIRRAAIYQEYMKSISLPSNREAIIPFNTWQGLAKSMKQLYEQPLHYLTNVLVKQWDQGRVGTDDYHEPLDSIIHPFKASTAIWAVEEVHRLTLSHEHLAKLWASDPMYPAFLDPTPSCPKEMKIV